MPSSLLPSRSARIAVFISARIFSFISSRRSLTLARNFLRLVEAGFLGMYRQPLWQAAEKRSFHSLHPHSSLSRGREVTESSHLLPKVRNVHILTGPQEVYFRILPEARSRPG